MTLSKELLNDLLLDVSLLQKLLLCVEEHYKKDAGMVNFIRSANEIHMDYELDKDQVRKQEFLVRIGGPEPAAQDVVSAKALSEEDMVKATAALIPSSNSSEKGAAEDPMSSLSQALAVPTEVLEPVSSAGQDVPVSMVVPPAPTHVSSAPPPEAQGSPILMPFSSEFDFNIPPYRPEPTAPPLPEIPISHTDVHAQARVYATAASSETLNFAKLVSDQVAASVKAENLSMFNDLKQMIMVINEKADRALLSAQEAIALSTKLNEEIQTHEDRIDQNDRDLKELKEQFLAVSSELAELRAAEKTRVPDDLVSTNAVVFKYFSPDGLMLTKRWGSPETLYVSGFRSDASIDERKAFMKRLVTKFPFADVPGYLIVIYPEGRGVVSVAFSSAKHMQAYERITDLGFRERRTRN